MNIKENFVFPSAMLKNSEAFRKIPEFNAGANIIFRFTTNYMFFCLLQITGRWLKQNLSFYCQL